MEGERAAFERYNDGRDERLDALLYGVPEYQVRNRFICSDEVIAPDGSRLCFTRMVTNGTVKYGLQRQSLTEPGNIYESWQYDVGGTDPKVLYVKDSYDNVLQGDEAFRAYNIRDASADDALQIADYLQIFLMQKQDYGSSKSQHNNLTGS